ncbi:MAG TPA: efflux RND transporter periplasmic adaptor subunit [Bryobacteraceae bacterium]|nr:efflux RND transporter periplasmic adaptor subunit [Bryobacteraceae bacterium]
MPSKDLKPKQRLGQVNYRRRKIINWSLVLLVCGGALFAGYRYTSTTTVEIPVVRVRRGDFVISVRTRGELASSHSIVLAAPQVPNLRLVKLVQPGKIVHKGDIVAAFDTAQIENAIIQRTTNVSSADSQIVQLKATQKMDDEADSMQRMASTYDVERARLDASKAEVLSKIDGEKNRITVTVTEGALNRLDAIINAHQTAHVADLTRLSQNKDKAVRDLNQVQEYLTKMEIRAPADGMVNILPNFRVNGQFGQTPPAFKEGDDVWTGAPIAEMPDLSQMYVDLKMDEVDRGKLRLGQVVRVRIDAIPDREFNAELNWISPIAALVFKGASGNGRPGIAAEKTFPARAQLKNLDARLRPGMSATAEVTIEKQPAVLMIPARASVTKDGKPAVYVQNGDRFSVRYIQVGKRNDDDMVVTSGLKEGDMIALEDPVEAAKAAKKL